MMSCLKVLDCGLILLCISTVVYAYDTLQSNHHNHRITKRQVSIEELIEKALNFVRPIIDTSKPIENAALLPKRITSNEKDDMREAEILGVPQHSVLADISICNRDARICKFLSCSASTFKNDHSVANLKLAAQILSDNKLRKAIVSDPISLQAACDEQALNQNQCKVFIKAFQLIDRFISTIDRSSSDENTDRKYFVGVQQDSVHLYDMNDAPPVPIAHSKPPLIQSPRKNESVRASGSRTWSSRPLPIDIYEKPTIEIGLPTFPPLTFTFPTFPTLPPLQKASVYSRLDSFGAHSNLFFNPFVPRSIFPTSVRQRRSIEFSRLQEKLIKVSKNKQEIEYKRPEMKVMSGGRNTAEPNHYDYVEPDESDENVYNIREKRADYYDDITEGKTNDDDGSGKVAKIQNDDVPTDSHRRIGENLPSSLIECMRYL